MKKLPYILLTSLVALISCQEALDTSANLTSNPNSSYLSFTSDDEFEAVTNLVAGMTDQELDAWEKEKGFVSYRSIWNQANNEWQNVASEDDRSEFLNKYSDILTIEDSTILPHVDIRLYQAIINREGIYQTNGYLNKVNGDVIISVDRREAYKLNGITISNREIPLKDGVRVYKYTGDPIESEARTNSTCTTHMTASYFHNESNCRNDRRVYISARSYVVLTTNSTGDYRQPRVEIKVWGTIRNATWCNWSAYSTALAYRNVSFTVMAWAVRNGVPTPQSYSRVLPDYAPLDDRLELPWDQPIGDRVHNQFISASPFTSFHGEGTSRGAHGVWVVLDCQ